MKLRNQLLTVSLVTLLVPWAGWKLVQELEVFLRTGQETALLAAARTVAGAVPESERDILLSRGSDALPLRDLPAAPQIDGYAADWIGTDQFVRYASSDGELTLAILGGRYGGRIYLHCTVHDPSPVRESEPDRPDGGAGSDGLLLYLKSARGLFGFRVQTAAPGRLMLESQSSGGGQMTGYWLDHVDGYQVELALPRMFGPVAVSLGAVDVERGLAGPRVVREAGTLKEQRPARWLDLVGESPELNDWLSRAIPAGTRGWIVDREGWVVARSDPPAPTAARQLTWAERILYRAVAGSRTELRAAWSDEIVRFDEPLIAAALAGSPATRWGQDPDSAVVRNTVAVPLDAEGAVRGAVIVEVATDGLLLVTNRALGRIMLTTLVLTLALAAALWFFATRLSHRVRRLSGAVSQAMDESGRQRALPLTGDGDELGDLARNNARLLRAVADYTTYLQKLAGRLSHELKTPLAITRSSLDNLASHELDEEARRYVARAREGVERQTAIVSAMSEASRLEAAIDASEWVEMDLRELLGQCVDAYRAVHQGREIELDLPATACRARCAPDLLAQGLDKLVDNAISLTGANDRVAVSLEPTDRGYRIRVFNSGTRLPDVLPEQLFDSLVSLREKGGGRHLGLGLHIVRLVAEAHGGRASARNRPEAGGVEFTIHLPREG